MGIGDVETATAGATRDVHYVDVGLYDVPAYGSVYILDTERPAIVDTGTGRNHELVLEAMGSLGIEPADIEVIAPTHIHLDHAGGAGVLAEACPNATVHIPERGASHLLDPEMLWESTKEAVGDRFKYYREPTPIEPDRLVELADGDEIDLGNHRLEVHDAPGHAPHQAVFYDRECDGVFAADAAGIHVPNAPDQVFPTSPPPSFDLEGCLADVEMLQDLDPSALYYGHFGPSSADGYLAQFGTVLEEWVDLVAAAAAEHDALEAIVDEAIAASPQSEVWIDRQVRAKLTMDVKGVLGYLDRTAPTRE